MSEGPIVVLIVFSFVTIIVFFTAGLSIIKSMVLKREQIKADALVRAEEVRAKNQLELEKLVRQDSSTNTNINYSDEDRVVRERKDV